MSASEWPEQHAPIQTRYDGYLFRSRLEARWAVFFRTLGYLYQYEPEGFDVGFGDVGERSRYLPDFYLPDTETWVEVKGSVAGFDRHLLSECVDWGVGLPGIDYSYGSTRGLLLLGNIPNVSPISPVPVHPILQHDKGGYVETTLFDDHGIRPVMPEHHRGPWHRGPWFDLSCGGLEQNEEAWEAVARHWKSSYCSPYEKCHWRVRRAYQAARSARFEFAD